MNGPSMNYFAQLHAGLDAAAPDPVDMGEIPSVVGPYDPNPGSPNYQPNPGAAGQPIVVGPPPGAPVGRLPPPAPPEPVDMGEIDAPPPPMPAPSGDAPTPMQPVSQPSAIDEPPDVQFAPVSSGQPAHEAFTRGPNENAALMASFEPEHEAATRNDFRNQIQADREQVFYEDQARQALAQQEAAQKVAAARAFQMEQMQLDYQDQIQKLGQMRYDDNRWWSNKSTLGKIGTTLLVGLGSLEALGNGGVNPVYQSVLREIDADAADQRLQYESGLAQAQGVHTAFQMMMDRFHNEDAAEAAVRAAGLSAAEAKLGSLHAQYGGVESANAADMLRSQIEAARLQTIAKGFKFVPATAGTKYQMTVRGQRIPGMVTEQRAQDIALKHGVEPAERGDDKLLEGGIQYTLEGKKAEAAAQKEAAKEGKDNTVRLPSGEVVTAPSQPEAQKLRDLSAQDLKIRQLVERAKTLRSEGFRANPGNAGELKSIQQQLRTAFSVTAQLGALSKDDIKIADGAVGDLTNPYVVTSAPERQLDAYARQVRNDVSNRVKTYSGGPQAAPRTTGSMQSVPGAVRHGGKKK